MEQNESQSNSLKKSFLSRHVGKLLLFLGSVAVFIGIIVIIKYKHYFPGPVLYEHDKWGQFGDFIGGLLNPIFALLAFFALLITIVIQSRELSVTTEELKKSAAALEEQGKSLKIQNFENTFFHMVRLHNDIVMDMDTSEQRSELHKGRDCFRVFYEKFMLIYHKTVKTTHVNQEKTSTAESQEELIGMYENAKDKINKYNKHDELIDKAYGIFFAIYQHEVGHYFRNLYTILKFIHESDIEYKKQYSNIIRAQLSSYELALLFYNCLWKIGKEKFRSLIEEYEFLENFNSSLLEYPVLEYPLYDERAYGDFIAPEEWSHP